MSGMKVQRAIASIGPGMLTAQKADEIIKAAGVHQDGDELYAIDKLRRDVMAGRIQAEPDALVMIERQVARGNTAGKIEKAFIHRGWAELYAPMVLGASLIGPTKWWSLLVGVGIGLVTVIADEIRTMGKVRDINSVD